MRYLAGLSSTLRKIANVSVAYVFPKMIFG